MVDAREAWNGTLPLQQLLPAGKGRGGAGAIQVRRSGRFEWDQWARGGALGT